VEKKRNASRVKLLSQLRNLELKLRRMRLEREADVQPDEFAVSAKESTDAAFTQAGEETLVQLNTGSLDADLVGAGEQFEVVRQVLRPTDAHLAFLSIRSSPVFAARLRGARSAVGVTRAAWLYPQVSLPLGAELSLLEINVSAGAKGPVLHVKVEDDQGAPVSGVKVRALLGADTGVNVAGTTNVSGVAKLKIPQKYDSVDVVLAQVEHTHWPAYADGMASSAIGTTPLVIPLTRLTPRPAHFGTEIPYEETAGKDVKVAVVDTGVGPHPLLVVAGGQNCVSGEPVGLVQDNGVGHGTHVAGIIAARGGAEGLWGVAPACTVLSYRVCATDGENYARAKSSDVITAVQRAVDDGCDLINVSLGSANEMPEIIPFLTAARDRGCVVVAAMGNDGSAWARFPARYQDVVGVSAFGRSDEFPEMAAQQLRQALETKENVFVPDFSNHGDDTDYIGPGVGIVSTYPGDRYAVMDGTSMAAPYVTGLTARLLSRRADILSMPREASRAAAILGLVRQTAATLNLDRMYEGNGHPR